MNAHKWIFALSASLLASSVAFAAGTMDRSSVPQIQAEQSFSPGAMSDEDVRKVQSSLNEAGFQVGPVDGIWGPRSESALRDFQRARGLDATGQLDEPTILALGYSREEFAAAEYSEPSRLSEADTRRVQESLKSQGYDVGVVDGIWGPATEKALREFQSAKGISPTGRLNEETILALGFSTSDFAAGEYETGRGSR